MRTACDSGYCKAVGFEGVGNTPLWSHQLYFTVFFAAQVGTEQFQAVLAEISGELSVCKTDLCKMLRDVEAEASTASPLCFAMYTPCQHPLTQAGKPGTHWHVLSKDGAEVCSALW